MSLTEKPHAPARTQDFCIASYAWLLRLFSPLIGLITVIEAIKRRGGWTYLRQRFGIYHTQDGKHQYALWVHCASVGEVNAVMPLLFEARTKHAPILVSTHTPSGKLALQRWQKHTPVLNTIDHVYLPLDFVSVVKRFIRRFSPQHTWMVESEIWPHLYQSAHAQGPLALINARFSAHRHQQITADSPTYWQRCLARLYRNALAYCDQVLCKEPDQYPRFLALGVPPNRLKVMGNLKLSPSPNLQRAPNPIARPFSLCASTHGDEPLWLVACWRALNAPHLLVIAPRHPERNAKVIQALQAQNLNIAYASQGDPITENTDLYWMDLMGQLMPLFSHAQTVVMGGSFEPKGGHNLLEPAQVGACILTGPDMRDFHTETQAMLEAGALVQVSDIEALQAQWQRLLASQPLRQAMGQRAKAWRQSQQPDLTHYLAQLDPPNNKSSWMGTH